jgi:hypothetical protein
MGKQGSTSTPDGRARQKAPRAVATWRTALPIVIDRRLRPDNLRVGAQTSDADLEELSRDIEKKYGK